MRCLRRLKEVLLVLVRKTTISAELLVRVNDLTRWVDETFLRVDN
jgi:hypothetical protein